MARLRFGRFVLDTDDRTLVGPVGPIAIEARPFDLLAHFVVNPGRLLTNDHLRGAVWGAEALSDSSVPTCVGKLRAVLADLPRSPRYIETVRGRGYRFLAQVAVATPNDAAAGEGFDPNHPPLVGRAAALEMIDRAVAAIAERGPGRLQIVRGEAGIGKSRIIDEAVRQARPRVRVLTAHCPEVEGGPSYHPWVQVLQAVGEEPAGPGPGAEFERLREALAPLYPEMSRSGCRIGRRPRRAVDQFSLRRHWLRTIRTLALEEPLLIAIEDVHRSDQESILLAEDLARDLARLPVVLLLTHRPATDTTSVTEALSRLTRTACCEAIDLPALSRSEIDSLVESYPDLEHPGTELVLARTQGNPFYVTQLLQSLRGRPVSGEAGVLPLPANARGIVSRVLLGMTRNVRDILATSSVLGREFAARLVAQVMGRAPDAILAELTPALRAGLIEAHGDTPDAFRFVHVLLRDALYEQLEPHERRELHDTVARNLERSDVRDDLVRARLIAHHFFEGVPVTPLARAREASLRAASLAARRFAHHDARGLRERALRLARADEEAGPAELCSIQLELAVSQLYCEDRRASRVTLFEAANAARDAVSPELLARCALALSPDFLEIEVGKRDPELIALLEEALESLSPANRALRSKLLARLSQAIQAIGPHERVVRLARESLELARGLPSEERRAVETTALIATAESLAAPGDVDERLTLLGELVDRSVRDRDLVAHMTHLVRLIAARHEAGDFTGVDTAVEDLRGAADRSGLSQYRWYPLAFDAMRAMMRGELDRADDLGNRFVEIGRRTDDINVIETRASQVALLTLEQDRLPSVRGLAQDHLRRQPHFDGWRAAVVMISAYSDREEHTRQLLEEFDPRRIEELSYLPGIAPVVAIAVGLARVGDAARARFVYDLLEPSTHRAASLGYGVGHMGAISHYLGLLARAQGALDAAIAHLREALELEGRWQAPNWQARSALELARTLHTAGRDAEEIRFLLESTSAKERPDRSPFTARRHLEVSRAVGLA